MDRKELLQRIHIDPKVMAGQPVIKGTRLTVEFILSLLEHGASPTEITTEYPGVTKDDIIGCIVFDESMEAEKLRRLLDGAEDDVSKGRIRPMRSFLEEFKTNRNIR